jgi:hypothetical protein
MKDLIVAFLGFISLWGFRGVLLFRVPCWRFLRYSLEHEKSDLNLLVFFLLVGFGGFFYLGCHVGDLSTNSLEYEKSDLSLFPLWGFII